MGTHGPTGVNRRFAPSLGQRHSYLERQPGLDSQRSPLPSAQRDKDGMWYCGQTTVHVLNNVAGDGFSSQRCDGRQALPARERQEPRIVELPPTQTVVAPRK